MEAEMDKVLEGLDVHQGLTLKCLQQLKKLVQSINPDMTTFEVARDVIEPLTRPYGTSFLGLLAIKSLISSGDNTNVSQFVETFSEDVGEYTNSTDFADISVCHAWDDYFIDMIDALEGTFKTKNDEKRTFWIDVLCVDLTIELTEVVKDFNEKVAEVGFRIADIGHTCLVALPWSDPHVLSRSWCLWEIYSTLKSNSKLSLATVRENGKSLDGTILTNLAEVEECWSRISLTNSQCYEPKAHTRIVEACVLGADGLDGADGMIADGLFESLQSTAIQRLSSIEAFLLSKSNISQEIHDQGVLKNYFYYGRFLLKYEKVQEAERLFLEALKNREKYLGRGHPETLTVLHHLANLLAVKEGDDYSEDAEQLYMEVIYGRVKVLGPDHPKTVGTINNFAVVLKSQQKFKESASMFKRALESRERILGPEHPYTINSMINLAELYSTMNLLDEAEKLFERAMIGKEKIADSDKKGTINVINNYAALLHARGKFEEAEPMYRKGLALSEEEYGPTHPLTITRVFYLGLTLIATQRFDESEESLTRALIGREKIYGRDHKETQLVVEALNLLKKNREEYKLKNLNKDELEDIEAKERSELVDVHFLEEIKDSAANESVTAMDTSIAKRHMTDDKSAILEAVAQEMVEEQKRSSKHQNETITEDSLNAAAADTPVGEEKNGNPSDSGTASGSRKDRPRLSSTSRPGTRESARAVFNSADIVSTIASKRPSKRDIEVPESSPRPDAPAPDTDLVVAPESVTANTESSVLQEEVNKISSEVLEEVNKIDPEVFLFRRPSSRSVEEDHLKHLSSGVMHDVTMTPRSRSGSPSRVTSPEREERSKSPPAKSDAAALPSVKEEATPSISVAPAPPMLVTPQGSEIMYDISGPTRPTSKSVSRENSKRGRLSPKASSKKMLSSRSPSESKLSSYKHEKHMSKVLSGHLLSPGMNAGSASVKGEEAADKTDGPSGAEPSAAEPSAAGPSAAEPSAAEPSAAEPSAAEPSASEPSAAEPSATESTPVAAHVEGGVQVQEPEPEMAPTQHAKVRITPGGVRMVTMETSTQTLNLVDDAAQTGGSLAGTPSGSMKVLKVDAGVGGEEDMPAQQTIVTMATLAAERGNVSPGKPLGRARALRGMQTHTSPSAAATAALKHEGLKQSEPEDAVTLQVGMPEEEKVGSVTDFKYVVPGARKGAEPSVGSLAYLPEVPSTEDVVAQQRVRYYDARAILHQRSDSPVLPGLPAYGSETAASLGAGSSIVEMKSVPEGEGAATGSTLSTNQMSGTLINSQTMGVKLSVLQIIRDYIKNFNPYLTTGEVVEHFVKPMTKHSKCSFIQLFDGKHSSQPEPMRRMINTDAEGWTTYDFHALFPEAAEEYVSFEGAAEVFISHAWSYEFCEFVKCLDEEFAMKSNKALWIDMFSLNQWKHGHKGSRPNSRGDVKLMPSFVKGLIEDIKTTCVVAIPWKEPTVFNRTWCMWEMFCTLQAKGKLHFITLAEYAYEINTTVLADLAYITKMLHSINLYQSKSTLAEDRRAIFEAIDRMGINGESINKMIIDAINAWYKSLAGTAIQAMEKKELKDDPSVDSLATNFFSMAKRLVDSGKLADAEIMFQKALDNRVKHLGPDHSETLSVLHRMADLMGAQGSLADAERMYREVLQSREAALGTDNPETLTLLNNLAIILKTQGKLEEAEEVFASVLEGRERALGVEHPDTLSSLNNLGVVLDTMEKFDDAQEIYEEALEGRERVLGAKHPYTLGTAANLAALHFTKGNFTEAEQLYRWAFSTDEIAIGNDDMHVLANYHNFGKVLEMDGRREEALIWFQRAYEGRRELFGLNHPQTQMSLLALTDSLQETGKHEHACELMKGAFHKYYVPESGAAVAISEGFMDSFGGGFAGSEPAGLPHQQLSIASAGSSTGDWKYYGMDTGMSTGLDRPMSQESLGTHIASTASSIGQNVVPGKVLEDNSTFGLAAFNVTNSNASQHSEAASSSQQWAHNRGLGVNPTTSNPVYLNSTYPSAKKGPTKMPPSIVQDETAKAGIPGPPVSLLKGSAQPFNTKILPNSLIQSVDFKPKYDTSVSYPSGSSAYGKKPARHQVNQASVFSSTAPPAIFGMVDPGQKMRVPGVPQPKPVKSASVAPRAPVMTAPDTAFKIGSSFYPTMEPATAPTVISEQRNLQEESQADEPASAQNVYDDAFPERPQSEEWDPYQAFSRIHGGAYASNQQGLGEPSRPSSSQEPDVLFLPNVFDSDRNKLNRIVAQRMQQRLSNASNSSAEEVITQIGARRSSALDKSQTLPTVPEGTNEVTPVISTSVSRQGVPHTETASEEQVMQTSSGQTVIREVVTVYKEAPAKEIIREKIFEKIVYVEKDTNKVVKEELVEKSEGGFPSLPSAVAPSVTTTTTTVTESVASGSTKPKIIVEDSNFSAPTVKDIVASPRKSNMSSPRKSARDSIPELSLARVGLGEMPSVKKMSSDMSLQSNNSARKKPSQSSPSTMVEKSPSGLKKQPSRIKKQGSGAVVSPRSISRSGTLTPMTQGTASPRRMASRGQSSRSVDSSMTMTARDAIQYATTGGIRLTKLLQIRDIVLKIDKRMTTTQFVERIIKPLTKRQNCSFIQLIYRFRHLDRLPVSLLAIDGASGKIPNTFLESLNLDYASSTYAKSQVFVSHAYSNLFVDMIESLEATFGKNKDPVFWIDFFVRNLHLENPDMMPSTVEGIVQDIGHTAAVMIPWKNPVALKRAWCLWEMYQTSVGNCKFSIATTKADKDIIETAMSDDASLEKLKSFFNNKISFTSSSSTVSQDKVDLHMMAAKVLGAHRRVDSEIAALCAQWVITREEEVFHESVDKCEDLVYEAKVAYKNGKGEEAAEKYKKSIEMCSRLLGPQHQDTLTTMHDYGVMLHDLGNHDQAEVVLQQCVYGKEQTHGDDHEETVSSLIGLGQVYRAKKDLRTAEIHFLRAHSALKSQYGLEHPRTNDVTKLLANLVDEREDHNEEEDAQRKVLQKAEEELGPEHPDTLEAMNRMAIVYAAHGRRQKAEDLLRKTLQLRRSTLGPHHPATLSTLVSLADFLKKIRRLDESEALFREAVEIESDVPADHPTLLATMDALANLLSERGKLEEAEALYRKVFTGRMKSLGIENPKTLISITNLAVSLLNQGKAKGAEALLRRALKGKETVMGEKHPDTLTAAHHLAVCLKDIEKYDESEDMYRRVYEGRKDMLGPTHETTLIALSNLGTLLASKYPHESEDAKVELEKARTCKQEALDGFESALGKNHPSTLKAANNLAALLSLMDNLNAAEDLYRRVLKSREVNLGKNHPDTLTSLHSLATVVKSQGDVEAAIAMYERALDGREKVLGAGHPDTQRTQKALDFCYAAADPDFEPEIDASDDPLIYAIEEDQIAYENPHKPADRPSSAHI